jgi:putative ABC transport system substrate-binding protein
MPAAAVRRGAEGLIVHPDAVWDTARPTIVKLAAKHKLPAMYPAAFWAAEGGLISHGVTWVPPYRRSAEYVDKILRGAKPADLPVEQPTTFILTVNLKTAKALGLTIPPSLLARADRVFE